ncbi:MAG: hypothetical protein GX892_00520 [Thermoanaerobacteraceae bacterium]|nr:hypothetical protein [Thermoanaerobacteraceae bacterium]
MSRKAIDMGAEHELSLFLDEYFYNRLLQNNKIVSFERIKDKSLQIQGIDVIITTKKSTVNIDEKAQLYYINQGLPTFAFEVNFLNKNGALSPGWLYNKNLLTDYFVLIWLTATHNNLQEIKAEDFINAECMMIKKTEIINYLSGVGYTEKLIEKIAMDLRSQEQYGKYIIPDQTDFYFYFSPPDNYSEQPINIVIRKNLLIRLAVRIYVVSKNKLARIK